MEHPVSWQLLPQFHHETARDCSAGRQCSGKAKPLLTLMQAYLHPAHISGYTLRTVVGPAGNTGRLLRSDWRKRACCSGCARRNGYVLLATDVAVPLADQSPQGPVQPITAGWLLKTGNIPDRSNTPALKLSVPPSTPIRYLLSPIDACCCLMAVTQRSVR